jgi:hypothetical protein
MGESFQVDADAHAKAKSTGEYGTPEDAERVETPEEKTAPDETKSIIPDEDPDAEPETKVEGEEEETTEEKKDDAEPTETEALAKEFEGWTAEFLENGTLTDETKTKVLETVFSEKIPLEFRDQVLETYQAGVIAIREASTRAAFDIVGGEESYQKMLEWGNTTLSKEETEAFDADVLGTDTVRRTAAIKGLYAQYQQATGAKSDFEPDLSHDAGKGGGEPIIGSRQELVRIMRTPEYDKDPAVREKVARQLRQSMATGKYIP